MVDIHYTQWVDDVERPAAVNFVSVDYIGRVLQLGREMAFAEIQLGFTLDNEEWTPLDMTFDETVIQELDKLVELWIEYYAIAEPPILYSTTYVDNGNGGFTITS